MIKEIKVKFIRTPIGHGSSSFKQGSIRKAYEYGNDSDVFVVGETEEERGHSGSSDTELFKFIMKEGMAGWWVLKKDIEIIGEEKDAEREEYKVEELKSEI